MATAKQQRAMTIYVENRGSISVSEAMRRAGYSAASAKNPKNLTSTDGWREMMDRFIPDERLLEKHSDLLDAKKIEKAEFPSWLPHEDIRAMILDAGGKPRNYETNPMTGVTHVWYWIDDVNAQKAALELAYKLKGKLKDKVEHSGQVGGLFGSDALTINVVDGQHNPQS